MNRWYHSCQNHRRYQIVTKIEEQNHVTVKIINCYVIVSKLLFILELHETLFNVTKRKIVSRISRYIYMTMITRFSERISYLCRYTGKLNFHKCSYP